MFNDLLKSTKMQEMASRKLKSSWGSTQGNVWFGHRRTGRIELYCGPDEFETCELAASS